MRMARALVVTVSVLLWSHPHTLSLLSKVTLKGMRELDGERKRGGVTQKITKEGDQGDRRGREGKGKEVRG